MCVKALKTVHLLSISIARDDIPNYILPSLFLILRISVRAMMSCRARDDIYVDVSINDNKNEGCEHKTTPRNMRYDVFYTFRAARANSRTHTSQKSFLRNLRGCNWDYVAIIQSPELNGTPSLTTFRRHETRHAYAHSQLVRYKKQLKWEAIPLCVFLLEYFIHWIKTIINYSYLFCFENHHQICVNTKEKKQSTIKENCSSNNFHSKRIQLKNL